MLNLMKGTTKMATATRVDPAETREVFAQMRQSAGRDEPVALGNVLDAVVKFTQVNSYTTFAVEYACVDGSFVIHFFPPPEAFVMVEGARKVPTEYLLFWQKKFPAVLSPVAEGYFKATYPQLMAQYVPEMRSWYMRAGGFANRLDPDTFLQQFFALLDRALDALTAAS